MLIISEDVTMYDLVLDELSRDGAFSPWRRSHESGVIGPRVLNHTANVDADIIEWTMDAALHPFAPQGITLADLLARNTHSMSLEKYSPKHGARLISPSQLCKHFNNRNGQSERADRCIIRFALPGYSRENSEACVFFWFEDGGSNGGGAGIYWYERFAGSWLMRSRCISYHGQRRITALNYSPAVCIS